MEKNDVYFVLPENVQSLEELNAWKRKWDYAPVYRKEIADGISIQEFGKTNLDRYNEKKSCLNENYRFLVQESVTRKAFTGILHSDNEDEWNHVLEKVRVAEHDGMIICILPNKMLKDYDKDSLRELNEKYDRFLMLPEDLLNLSNNTAMMIFGMDNYNLYETIKNSILNKMDHDAEIKDNTLDIMDDMRSSIDAVSEFHRLTNSYLQETDESLNKDVYKSFKKNKIGKSINERYMDDILPFFTPDEMEGFGVFSGEANLYSPTPDNHVCGLISTEEWFNQYKGLNGRYNPADNYIWENTLNILYSDYDKILESGDEQKILDRKQSILELGWNPEIQFDHKTAKLARIRRLNNDNLLEMEDLTEFYDQYSGEPLEEETSVGTVSVKSQNGTTTTKKVKAIYITLLGIHNKLRSRVIRTWTKSEWSHSAIALDPSLEVVYSFSTQDDENGKSFMGFNPESIGIWLNTDKESTVAVHAVFVTEEQFRKVKDALNWYKNHQYETSYDVLNLLRIVAQKASDPLERMKMICSQFVYSILNLVDIHLANTDFKASNLVTPEDLYRLDNPRIYRLYEGRADKYNPNKIKRMVRDLLRHVDLSIFTKKKNITTLREMMIDGCTIYEYRQEVCRLISSMAKDDGTLSLLKEMNLCMSPLDNFKLEFHPIQESSMVVMERVRNIDDNGKEIIIRTVDDVNTEYFKCHRNLISYEKAGNYQGMKDELCKLKYLDNFAVKHMKNKRDKHYKEYADAHARITNDFNKYLKIVTDREPDFNFSEYYRNSEWYDGEVRISKKIIDDLLKIFDILLKKFPV